MSFVQNFPFISILLSLFSGPISTILDAKKARRLNTIVIAVLACLSGAVLVYVLKTGESFVYTMGHFPAPWGNEIRVGVLEAMMALFFCAVMLLCMIGGVAERDVEIEESKQNLYYVMVNLLLCSLLALIYTNDLFNAYVFVEINTISACGLIMIRQTGRTFEAATRYMIMSLLGSGLLLLGIVFLYDLTGHLLMSNIKEQIQVLVSTGAYHVPLLVAISLISVGLAIKSALFPFHGWLPDAYGYSTVSSAAILSSLVSKGYIFLLIKIFYRVIGFSIITQSKVINILFIFGISGMLFGSISAIRQSDLRRMIAFSSVAQIGYIYMGFGFGTTYGMVASIFHILTHAATKSLLFVAASGLTDASHKKRDFQNLVGAGYRNKLAGITFTVGSLSMVGFPMFSGFISKILFAQAAMENEHKMLLAVVALAISTILNAMYFLKTVITIYTPHESYCEIRMRDCPLKSLAMICFIILNLILGLSSDPIVRLIEQGLAMFS